MCKRRRLLQPKVPSSAIEFGVLLPESQYSKKHLKTAIYEDQVAIILGSSCMLNMINNSVHIQFDGTFCVVPKIFLQIFTLFIHVNGHTLPALHVLMTRKTETLYRAAILAILELIPNFILNWPHEKLCKQFFLQLQLLVAGFTLQKQFMRKFRKLDCQNCIKQTNIQKVDSKFNGFAFSS